MTNASDSSEVALTPSNNATTAQNMDTTDDVAPVSSQPHYLTSVSTTDFSSPSSPSNSSAPFYPSTDMSSSDDSFCTKMNRACCFGVSASDAGGDYDHHETVCCCCNRLNSDKPMTEEQRAKKRRNDWIILILGAIVGIITLVLSIIAYIQIQRFTAAYADIISTWETYPMTDIQFVTSFPPAVATCPNGYNLVSFAWPGTYDACQGCNHSGNNSDTSSCGSTQYSDGCSTLNGYPSITVDYWPGNSLCIANGGMTAQQRDAVKPYYSSGGLFACSAGYQVCGNPNLLDINKVYCWSNTLLCPITDIAFTTNDVDLTQPQYTSSGYNITKISIGAFDGNNQYLYYARGGPILDSIITFRNRSLTSFYPTNLPLVDIQITYLDACYITGCQWGIGRGGEFSADASYWKANGRGYTLKSVCSGCSTPGSVPGGSISPNGIDYRYSPTGLSRPEINIWQKYPNIPAPWDSNVSPTQPLTMIIRSEVPWKTSCAQNRQAAINKNDTVSDVQKLQLGLLIVSIITLIVLTIIIPIMELCNRDEGKTKVIHRTGLFGQIITKGLVISFTISTMVLTLGSLGFFSDVEGPDPPADFLDVDYTPCADALSSEIFRKLSDTFTGLSNKNVANSAVTLFDGGLHGLSSLSHFLM